MTTSSGTKLSPLLGAAFPPNGIPAEYLPPLIELQEAIDTEIAPRAQETDQKGRYPTASITALKQKTSVLASALPKKLGGLEVPQRWTLEAEVRLAIADSAVAQVFKIHDEVVREVLTFCPPAMQPRLASAIIDDKAIVGLAVAESGRRVDDPMKTTALPQPDGSFVINGVKIYTTGAAEADLIATWAFNPAAPGVDLNPAAGMQLNLVPAGTPGVSIKRDWDALGQRATDSGTIVFENVRTEPKWNATEPGQFPPLHASLRYQAGFAALMIGLGIGALRAAVPFISEKSRPWPSANVARASEDPYVQRLAGDLVADLAAAYALTLSTGDLLDAFERGEVDRTAVAIPIYAAKVAATRAALKATSEIYTLMGTRAVARTNAFDRYWRNVRTISLHDPVEWKYAELGHHVLTGWDPPWGLYQ
jgi:alkylation response protein AidB-like acyl-CoA dehydrogenase